MATILMRSADIRDLSLLDFNNNCQISDTYARTGTYSYYLPSGRSFSLNVPNMTTVYSKFANLCPTQPGGPMTYLQFREGTTVHISIKLDYTPFKITVSRNATLLATSTNAVLSNDAWHLIEAKVVIHDSAGSVEIKVNGNSIDFDNSLESIDTRNGANGYADNCYFASNGGSYFDDIVIDDSEWPGVGGLELITVSGNGNYSNWTASSGSNYECVDDNPPNDTDYISTDASVTGTRDSFEMSNLSVNPISIPRVGVFAKVKLDDAGVGTVKSFLRSNGTDADGPDEILGVNYSWAESYHDVDPDTTSTWTKDKVDLIEAGVVTA